jgi:precorrin-2 dehydrogenase / sirohydrochlorin ferrochelatase
VSSHEPSPPPLIVGLRLEGVPVLVVGGGPVATRRALRLAGAGAHLTVVSPEATDQLAGLAEVWHHRRYEPGDVEGMVLVVTATGDPEVDARVVGDARASGAWVNHAGDADLGTVIVPPVAADGDVTVAVTTGGRSPSLARWLAAELSEDLVPVAAEAARLMGELRAEMLAARGSATHPGWTAALDEGLLDLLRVGDRDGAERLLRRHLGFEA